MRRRLVLAALLTGAVLALSSACLQDFDTFEKGPPATDASTSDQQSGQ
jgi:hypothetical protein